MASILKIQSFYGTRSEAPHCYLLQIDDFRILLDCGWDENFNKSFVHTIKRHLGSIDAIIISHSSCLHLGALPYLIGKCNLKAPIFATYPVYKMGQMFMYDLYQSHNNNENFDLFSLDNIDMAFENFHLLKYSQTHTFIGKGVGIQITPFPSGHSIGGAVWRIMKDNEEQIIYAVDFNNKKERHLNPCNLLVSDVVRPYMMITDAHKADIPQTRRRTRDEQLLSHVIKTIRNNGNALICIDSAGRLLELAHLFDQMWSVITAGVMTYSLVILNNVAYNVIEFAKSQVEWMSNKIVQQFEDHRNNPYQLKNVHLVHNVDDLDSIHGFKVVLASQPDLQCGYSRELFIRWAGEEKNTVIFTSMTSPDTLARKIMDNPNQKFYNLNVIKKVELCKTDKDYILHTVQKPVKPTPIPIETVEKKFEVKEEPVKIETEESDDESTMPDDSEIDLMANNDSTKRSVLFYPYKESKSVTWDDYGEFFNIADLNFDSDKEIDTKVDEIEIEKTPEPVIEPIIPKIPTKIITESVDIEIKANVLYIDFEGRADGESIQRILQHIKPQLLVLVRCSNKVEKEMREFVMGKYNIDLLNIYHINSNAVHVAQSDKFMYQVKISDSLFNNITFKQAGQHSLAWIDGIIDLQSENVTQKDKDKDMPDLDNQDDFPVLLPTKKSKHDHKPVYINPPKLSNLKTLINAIGIHTEFNGGVLICNGNIALKRKERGLVEMEGVACESYFKIRNLLYEQYAII